MKHFTKEEIKELNGYLGPLFPKKEQKEKIDNFIHNIEILYNALLPVVSEQTPIKDYRAMVNDLVEQVSKLKQKTDKLKIGFLYSHGIIVRNDTIKTWDSFVPEKWEKLVRPKTSNPRNINTEEIQVMKDANATSIALEKLINSLQAVDQKHTKPVGRKPADDHGICLNLGYYYYKAFNKMPSTSKDGPFFQVLKIFLEMLSLPSKDPTRLIKNSLPELKRGLKIEREHEKKIKGDKNTKK